ncbi:NUDIX hydrolase [Pseudoxanthomonas sp. 10H]|uniref:NUDIX hydrolase n=1 Tax=Pseudoxanthomonas sp. 10H TaxID=3242729 RepID=UPI003559087B
MSAPLGDGGDAAGPIRTVAAVIAGGDGRVLLVRKRGSSTFIQPGGKREPGEDALATLARELDEELGVRLLPGSARRLGEFEDAAVNEPGRRVRAEAFVVEVEGEPRPGAEIAETAWVVPRPPYPVPVAPLSAGHILPALMAVAGHSGAGSLPVLAPAQWPPIPPGRA